MSYTLYYSKGSCSLSPNIVLKELDLPHKLVRVDLKTKKIEDGRDFLAIHRNGYVPVLEMASGQILTEGPAIIQYLADQVTNKSLIPACGSFERTKTFQWLTFISTELHKGCSPLFNPVFDDKAKAFAKERLSTRLGFVETSFKGDFLQGDHISVADIYLFVVLTWMAGPAIGIAISQWPNLTQFFDRMLTRPAVQAALTAEGLTAARL